MNYEHIIFDVSDGVATITLNRAPVLNSFNQRMATEVQHALDRCGEDKAVRAILLTGAGRGFCAGQDLAEATADDAPDIAEIVARQYNPIIDRLRNTPKPIVCAVNGVAAGAGANIAYACDLTIAAASANFIQSFIKIGLIPDSGGTFTLPRLVGMQRAFGQMILADKVSAQQAASMGLIWKAVADDVLLNEAMELCRQLAQMPTLGIALTKEALNRSLQNDLSTQLEVEKKLQAKAGASHDMKEGVQAFLEKRKPVFKGQ